MPPSQRPECKLLKLLESAPQESQPDPLDLIEANVVPAAVVDLSDTNAGLVRHSGCILQRAAVAQLGGDPPVARKL